MAGCRGWQARTARRQTLDELRDNLKEVLELLLEDGEPEFDSEFVGTQTVEVTGALARYSRRATLIGFWRPSVSRRCARRAHINGIDIQMGALLQVRFIRAMTSRPDFSEG